MTNTSKREPSGDPFGTSMCDGHPQPQNWNCAKSSALEGWNWLPMRRKERSYGIVTLDCSERRRISFEPGATVRNEKNWVRTNDWSGMRSVQCLLTVDRKFIHFNGHCALVAELKWLTSFIEFWHKKYTTRSNPKRATANWIWKI